MELIGLTHSTFAESNLVSSLVYWAGPLVQSCRGVLQYIPSAHCVYYIYIKNIKISLKSIGRSTEKQKEDDYV
jgi:hypothetical protein